MRTSGTANSAGFTLVELLVVLAIMALLIAVAMPALSAGQAFGARERALAELRADIIAARAESHASGWPQPVSFEDGGLELAGSLDPGGRLLVYADGSSTGGTVTLDGEAIATIDWLTSEVRDVR